jgi:hypothetical protein
VSAGWDEERERRDRRLRRGVGDTAAAARWSAPPPLPSAVALDRHLAGSSEESLLSLLWEQDYAARAGRHRRARGTVWVIPAGAARINSVRCFLRFD